MYTIINYTLHSEPNCFNELNINEIWFWDIKPFYSILILVSLILLSRACNNEDLSLKEAALNNAMLREVGQSWLQAIFCTCIPRHRREQSDLWPESEPPQGCSEQVQKLQDTWRRHGAGAAAETPFQSFAKVLKHVSSKSKSWCELLCCGISFNIPLCRNWNRPWESFLYAFYWGWFLPLLFSLLPTVQ